MYFLYLIDIPKSKRGDKIIISFEKYTITLIQHSNFTLTLCQNDGKINEYYTLFIK